ncbi:GGDEF domain-containing protein [Schinkia sp. CFF1]
MEGRLESSPSECINDGIMIDKDLNHLTLIDNLTRLPNYSYFQDIYNQTWQSALGKLEPVSLALFDFDHLELFNESYGFDAGNNTILRIGTKVKSLLKRPEDFVARCEGGKFIILLPDTRINGVLTIAEIIRQEIEKMRIPHHKSTTSSYVTVSFGVGTKTPFIWENPIEFYKAVEQAMDSAKKGGRNQVIWNNVLL